MPKEKSPDPVRKHPPVTPDSTIHDVISHPAFRGFGRFILPLDRGTADLRMPLSRMGTLLPYHSHVNLEKAVEIINRMVEEAGTGRQIFYSFYSGKQKRQDASRENTGLFFFRGKPGAPFAVICPGGGFSYVGSIHEGFPHALELSRKGYNAFVLQYRTGSGAWACEDLAAAISYIFRNAVSLNVGTADYSVWGSSAGARMAAAMGSCGPSSFGYQGIPGPGAVIMAYTGYSGYTGEDPPTFVLQGEQDGIAGLAAVSRRVQAMKRVGVEVEYHTYKNLGHGFGLGTGTEAEGWTAHAIRFWEAYMSHAGSSSL